MKSGAHGRACSSFTPHSGRRRCNDSGRDPRLRRPPVPSGHSRSSNSLAPHRPPRPAPGAQSQNSRSRPMPVRWPLSHRVQPSSPAVEIARRRCCRVEHLGAEIRVIQPEILASGHPRHAGRRAARQGWSRCRRHARCLRVGGGASLSRRAIRRCDK